MKRLEREGQVAYRDRRWGWSLIFFCLVVPVAFLMVQDGIDRGDRAATRFAMAAAAVSVVTSFALLRTHTLLIDRNTGTLVSSRLLFCFGSRKSYPLSQVKTVRLTEKVLEHPTTPTGRGGNWIEHRFRIGVEVDQAMVVVHEGLSGASGRTLAVRLAKDLGVRVRNEF